MAESNHCGERGLLVDGDDWLPTDAHDYHSAATVPFIGCNHLMCGACGAPVRQQLGFSRVPALAALQASADWTTLPEYTGGSSRLYACRCTAKLAGGPLPLELPEGAEGMEDELPWRCAGHPTLDAHALHANIDGFHLNVPGDDPDTVTIDWDHVARHLLSAKTALHARVDSLPGFQAHRLYDRLSREEDQAALSHAIAEHVADAGLRAAVVLFFAGRPMAAGIGVVANYALLNPELFQPVPAGWGPYDRLDVYLANTFANHLVMQRGGAQTQVLRDALRTFAVSPPGLGPTVMRLVWTDPEWTQDNVSAIVMADPKAWRTVLGMLRPTRVGPAMDAGFGLVAAGVATRDEVLLVLRGVSPPEVVSDIARIWPPEPS